MDNDFFKIISEVAFPIFVSVFLLFRLEKSIKDLNQNITQLTLLIEKKFA